METADQNREGTPLLKRADVILALGLEPHVEGGAYRRVYESAVRLPSGERSASSTAVRTSSWKGALRKKESNTVPSPPTGWAELRGSRLGGGAWTGSSWYTPSSQLS